METRILDTQYRRTNRKEVPNHESRMYSRSWKQAIKPPVRDYATYGKPMRKGYPNWNEDGHFETGYENYVYERRQERIEENRE